MEKTAPAQSLTLGFLLRSSYELLQSRVYDRLERAGYGDVRSAHSAVLRNLEPAGARMSELARRIGISKQSVGYLVEDLVKLGYLSLADDPTDRRARLVLYTERGQGLLAALIGASAEVERECMAALGAERVVALRGILQDLLAPPR